MSIVFKNFQQLLLRSSIKVSFSILTNMSSSTRTLRSMSLVKTRPTENNSKSQIAPKVNKYFENKQIKEEPNIAEKSAKNKKSDKNSKNLKLKQEDNEKLKLESTVPSKVKKTVTVNLDIVKREVLSDDDFVPISTNPSSTLEPMQAVVKHKAISLKSKKAQKTVIKSEPNSPDIVKSEVLSDDDFVPISTNPSSALEPMQAEVNQKPISLKSKKAQKTVIKSEPNSPDNVKSEVLTADDFVPISTNASSTLELMQAGVNQKPSSLKSKKAQKTVIKTEPNEPDIVKSEILATSSAEPLMKSPEKNSPKKRKNEIQKAEKAAKIKTEHVRDVEDVVGWEPEHWREVLDNILEMRKLRVAPVDSLGCEECPEKGVSPEIFRYQSLISVMLSSQTRDEVTYAATQRLIAHGLTVDSILNTADEKIGELIYPAGFWKSKVKYIKKTTQILKDQYNGDIPRTFKELCKLPGVGPKMANIVMSVGWNDTVGIAVDTHVHRISNRLGWVPKPTKDPEQTRKALEAWLPKALWEEVSFNLVGFGQTLCKSFKPKCDECLNSSLCPSSTKKV